ncbi:hypothetical protein H1P_1950007 [Hyella patelloides LEGE 07179]|uniref:Uncharacterized protein n=1 Tax=Hyella patelloides LEGE 07179 TaxID=945734 RepID=A0A563VPK7_9CYAN|nr:hypothetical protein H1P_1950007 [Hyella patelloides LEGE 07179]
MRDEIGENERNVISAEKTFTDAEEKIYCHSHGSRASFIRRTSQQRQKSRL